MGSPPSSVASYVKSRAKERHTTPATKKSKIGTPEADLRKPLAETDLIKKSMEQAEDEDSVYCRGLNCIGD